MKLLNQSVFEFGVVLVICVSITACVSEPVIVEWPANHPANPRSPETVFIPPPNPFQNSNLRVDHEVQNNASMTHEKNQPEHQHQMSPDTRHYSGPSQDPEEQNPQHRHKGHD